MNLKILISPRESFILRILVAPNVGEVVENGELLNFFNLRWLFLKLRSPFLVLFRKSAIKVS